MSSTYSWGVLSRHYLTESLSRSGSSRVSRIGKGKKRENGLSYLNEEQQCFLKLQFGKWAAGGYTGLWALQRQEIGGGGSWILASQGQEPTVPLLW